MRQSGEQTHKPQSSPHPSLTSDNAVFREDDVTAVLSVDEDAEAALHAGPEVGAVVDVLQEDVRRELVAFGRRVRGHAAGRPRAAVQLHAHADRPRVPAVGQEAHLGRHDGRHQVVGFLHVGVLVAGEDLRTRKGTPLNYENPITTLRGRGWKRGEWRKLLIPLLPFVKPTRISPSYSASRSSLRMAAFLFQPPSYPPLSPLVQYIPRNNGTIPYSLGHFAY